MLVPKQPLLGPWISHLPVKLWIIWAIWKRCLFVSDRVLLLNINHVEWKIMLTMGVSSLKRNYLGKGKRLQPCRCGNATCPLWPPTGWRRICRREKEGNERGSSKRRALLQTRVQGSRLSGSHRVRDLAQAPAPPIDPPDWFVCLKFQLIFIDHVLAFLRGVYVK